MTKVTKSFLINHADYNKLYGPTKGDSIRLADTDLFIKVEKDYTVYGSEIVFGLGKTARAGMGQSNLTGVDTVITNVVIVDHTGIYKADIGIKDNFIVAIGKAGDPANMPGVDIIIGTETDIISGEGMIITAGAIDSNFIFSTKQQIDEALASGVTTLLGGGTGPSSNTIGSGTTPGKMWLNHMLQLAENLPVNVGFLGKGNIGYRENEEDAVETLGKQVISGAMGLCVHEDCGAIPEAIKAALNVADGYDVQCYLQSDSLNERGYIEDTINTINGRSIHVCVNDGHMPDVFKFVGQPNVLPVTNCFNLPTQNTQDELFELIMRKNRLRFDQPIDVQLAKTKVNINLLAAQSILHDKGAISMIASGSVHASKMIANVWQTAHLMKKVRGSLENDSQYDDNTRVKRYIAKYTINSAIAYGISHKVGSIEVGKLADLVLWQPAFFGIKPAIVLKGGMIVNALLGERNTLITSLQPQFLKRTFNAESGATTRNAVTFVSQSANEYGSIYDLKLKKKIVEVLHSRPMKSDMIGNNATPSIEVDPKTYIVRSDGEKLEFSYNETEPLPLTQLYSLF